MSSGHIVCIKTRPYLKDFFVNRYGPKEPIKATTTNKLFPYLLQYLTPKPTGWKPPCSENDLLLIELPFNDELNIRCYNFIHPRHYPIINSFFYGLFFAQFIDFMNDKVIKQQWPVKYAIINFMFDNGILDKGEYDSIKRIYYRYRFPETEKFKESKKNILTTFHADSVHIRHQFSGLNEII
jgi:hypothetical protein